MRAPLDTLHATQQTRIARVFLQGLLLILAVVAAGAVSVFILKQDANWDLENYHFYNAWAFVHDRLGWDLAPAQLQSFHNPLVELPFFWMVSADWPPQCVSFVMAVPAGVGVFFLGKIVVLLFRDLPVRERWLYIALAFAVGVTASGPISLISSTTNEWQGAALVMIALWLVLRRADEVAIGWRSLAAAGLLCGIASALKLTAAIYALGLCAALLLRAPALRRGVREAFGFGGAVTLGLLLTGGPWMSTLYAHFANPLFPYFNNIFRSPWWDPVRIVVSPYGPHTLYEWLSFPFPLFGFRSSYVGEMRFRDWRLPLLYLVFIASAVVWAARRLRARSDVEPPGQPLAWRVLLVFWAVSFVAWIAMHSIYRYLIPLELLCGALTIYLLRICVPARWVPAAASVYAVLAIATVRYPDFWHVEYGKRYFLVNVPPVAPHAVVLLINAAPMAYVLPFFPSDARFLGARNNLNDPTRDNLFEREVAKVIREHDGPLYSLTWPPDEGIEVLKAHGLRFADRDRECASVRSNMPTSPLQLCRLRREGGRDGDYRTRSETYVGEDAVSLPASPLGPVPAAR